MIILQHAFFGGVLCPRVDRYRAPPTPSGGSRVACGSGVRGMVSRQFVENAFSSSHKYGEFDHSTQLDDVKLGVLVSHFFFRRTQLLGEEGRRLQH